MIITFLEFVGVCALKQMVISISGLYLSSIRSILLRFIRLNLASGLVRLYFLIIFGTKVSARVGVVPIFIKSDDLDLYVLAMK